MVPEALSAQPHVALRRQRLEALVDLASGVGLEIGPLDSALATTPPWDVRYVDVRDAEGLREHYRGDPNVALERIVELDFVLQHDGKIRTLGDAAAPCAPYRWIVASHVVEHVPDLVGWLAEVASLLEDGCPLFLVVPDRRFTFDAIRPATTVGQLLEAHTRRETTPSERAVYDYFRSAVHISAASVWDGTADLTAAPKAFTFEGTVSMREAALRGEYVDSHVWVFSPAEFVAQFSDLSELDLCDFTIERILSTAPGELEFNVLLRRLPRDATIDQRNVRRRKALAALMIDEGSSTLDPPDPAAGTNARTMEVSELEAKLISGKRAAMRHLRALRVQMRQRTSRARPPPVTT